MCYLWDFYALLQQIGLLWRGPLLKLFKLPISDSFSSIEDFTYISPLPLFMESCSLGFWDLLASLGDFWVALVFLVLFLPFFIWTDFDYWLTTCPLDLKTFGKMKNRLSYWLFTIPTGTTAFGAAQPAGGGLFGAAKPAAPAFGATTQASTGFGGFGTGVITIFNWTQTSTTATACFSLKKQSE